MIPRCWRAIPTTRNRWTRCGTDNDNVYEVTVTGQSTNDRHAERCTVERKPSRVTVTDVSEAPLAPAAPVVSATAGDAHEPGRVVDRPGRRRDGDPELRGAVPHGPGRLHRGGTWTAHAHSGTGTTTAIGSLTASTAYEVQVRARNGIGWSPWSDPGQGTAGGVTFAQASYGFTLAENADGSGTVIALGTVSATHRSGETVRYAIHAGQRRQQVRHRPDERRHRPMSAAARTTRRRRRSR